MSSINSTTDGEASIEDKRKRDLIHDCLDHIGYERELGEGVSGACDKVHLQAMVAHMDTHRDAIDVAIDNPGMALGVELGLEDVEDTSEVQARLLASAIAGAGYHERVVVDEDGEYRPLEGALDSLRREELVAVYKAVMQTPPADRAWVGDRDA